METIYSWNFSSDKQRWGMWYIIAISVAIWLIIWWFLVKQYWLSFVLILISWLFYFVENNSPDLVQIEINELWIKINTIFYDFVWIESFSILYHWENAILARIILKQKWIKVLDLEINNQIAIDLKKILPNFIKEDDKITMSNIDKIIRLLKL